jgi:hypothetical protein
VPGTAVAIPSVLVIERSPVGRMVLLSVAWVTPGVGSVTPEGSAVAAVFVSVPAAVVGASVPVTV